MGTQFYTLFRTAKTEASIQTYAHPELNLDC